MHEFVSAKYIQKTVSNNNVSTVYYCYQIYQVYDFLNQNIITDVFLKLFTRCITFFIDQLNILNSKLTK